MEYQLWGSIAVAVVVFITAQKSHYPPGNRHGSRFSKCDISRSLPRGAQAIIKVSGHQYQWLAGGFELEIGQF